MTFISYAQNFEDVILWRALKHVQNGFYIDIGAQHPINDSVSKAFYEHGWRGIHIEPVPEYAEMLRQARPDEIVLECAIGNTDGTITLNVFSGSGLSTVVAKHTKLHQIESKQLQVPVLTLSKALIGIAPKEVHWLKIDVEGFEKQVLQGWDSKILRPWIMVIEATVPNSTEQNYQEWESILLKADYEYVYFDGLNRFYVAKEHNDLKAKFSSPPNVFDHFELSDRSLMCKTITTEAHKKITEISQQASQVTEELQQNLNIQQQLQVVNNSLSARVEGLLIELGASNSAAAQLKELNTSLSLQIEKLLNELSANRANFIQLRQEQALVISKVESLSQELDLINQHNTQLVNQLNGKNEQIDRYIQDANHVKSINDQLESELKVTKNFLEEHKIRTNKIIQELHSIYQSKSWKITKPLRITALFLSKVLISIKKIYRMRNKISKLFIKNNELKVISENDGIKIAIDLTPMIPGGVNGGSKILVIEIIKNISKAAPDIHFILLLPQRMEKELKELQCQNISSIRVLDENLCLTIGTDVVTDLGASLLFCPYTYSIFANKHIPIVSIVYDLQYRYLPQFFTAAQIKERDSYFIQATQHTGKLVCISSYVRQTVIENAPNYSPGDIVTIYCIISAFAQVRKKIKFDQHVFDRLNLINENYLFYPANFWHHKNHEVLLAAFRKYIEHHPNSDLKLVLTGHPCERMELLKEQVAQIQLSNRVLFLGYVSSETLEQLMAHCYALIFPSLYEGFGMPVLEAMSYGRPVLCSNVTALPEIVGNAALLFDPNSSDDIMQAIVKLQNTNGLRNEMVQKGYARIKSFPSPEMVAGQYLTQFRDVLRQARPLK